MFKGRVPLYAPDKCPDNELLYPGNQEHDWICDCGLGRFFLITSVYNSQNIQTFYSIKKIVPNHHKYVFDS